jgi:hypothetical protein
MPSIASRPACVWSGAWSRSARRWQLYDLSLGEFLEDLVRDAFTGLRTFSDLALAQAAELMRIYGLAPLHVPHDASEARG